MGYTVENTKQVLLEQLRAELVSSESDERILAPFLEAIGEGRSRFDCEPWHELNLRAAWRAADERNCSELLLRAETDDGQNISPEHLSKLTNPRAAYLFDKLIVLMAVDQAVRKNQFPVSINISARNATDGGNLLDLHHMLRDHFGDSLPEHAITFELLENNPADKPMNFIMAWMRELGYKFAIDDASHKPRDARRLENLGPLADIVKIDGKTVGDYFSGKVNLANFLERVREHAPKAEILCEYVGTAEQALELRKNSI